MNRGDIVLVSFPFTDLTTTKVRPAVVISNDSINTNEEDIILVFISSAVPLQIKNTDFVIKESERYFQGTGLKGESVFRMAKIVTLSRRLVRRKIGEVSGQTKTELDKRLRRALAL